MNTLTLSWRFLLSRPLTAVLNCLLLSLGLASIAFMILLKDQLDNAFERDLAGIDLVVGAKGSPLQLILAGVFHLDVPGGNVPMKAMELLRDHPQVALLIPISLGDNLDKFRIVGTTLDYPKFYGAQLAQGAWWTMPMQVVLGAQVAMQTGLKLGDTFPGSHGLGQSVSQHDANLFKVAGVMAATGTVLDRLILTATESVWEVHEKHEPAGAIAAVVPEREITLALIQYKSPLAAVSFPRFVNSSTTMQAAAPAIEITRLLKTLGVGIDMLRALAVVLVLTATLSVFIALWNAVRERRADLALLRMLGAARWKVAALPLCEALCLAFFSCVLGLLMGQGLLAAAGWLLRLDQSVLLTAWAWPLGLCWLPLIATLVASLAAALPAMGAYRVSVFELLR